jgi:ABC-2 type transport system ATP-binding protein
VTATPAGPPVSEVPDSARAASTAGRSTAITVAGLYRRFGQVAAVDGLSFRLARGSLLALLGPNGAGKTTTVEICEGFTKADAGQVRVLGLDPWRQGGALRPRIGVMLQAGGAHASARAGEMLGLMARCSANPLDPGWLLDVLGLSSSARTPIRRLSGGQVQRLGLAMALVGRPEMLFLDEPTAGMDPQARHVVWDLLRAARSDGVSILLTTHLLDEAELLADRIVIIDKGRSVADGTLEELTGGSSSQLRFRATPGLDIGLLRSALPLGFAVAETAPGRYELKGDVTPGTMATVTSFCARVGVMPTGLQVGGRSLDEVYLELTGKELRG